MSSSSQTTPERTAPSADPALAWAERRHARLERLADLGMHLAEEVVQRAVDSPYHPELKHDPGRTFAQVSRAVRFTLALQARVEKEILALRNGTSLSGMVETDGSMLGGTSERPPLSLRLRARDAVAEAIERESPERDASESALDRLNENLIDRETYDTLLTLPFDECIEAICADLGVDPRAIWGSDEGALAEPADRAKRPDPPAPEPTRSSRSKPTSRSDPPSARSDRVVQLEPG